INLVFQIQFDSVLSKQTHAPMEGRSALCFLVVLTLLAASPALAAGTRLPCPCLFHLSSTKKYLLLTASIHPCISFRAERCEQEQFFSRICMDWLCAQECASQNPDMRVKAAHCTAKGVKRYCHCTMCYK
uniref:Knottin scorpion toxin-like domain-containing protein n=1 Tax=Aegilops tauschii subsp. strangulata TaxID=200361 RepID=A0A453LI04_AEGTS